MTASQETERVRQARAAGEAAWAAHAAHAEAMHREPGGSQVDVSDCQRSPDDTDVG
jgi:hypothetical protein